MKDIKEAVGELSLDRLRALSHALAALQGERRECEIKPRGAQVDVIPLSLAQERLWFLEQFEPLGSAYNNSIVLELEGELDQAALERSFAELARRHESLRTRIETTADGQGLQVIDPPGGFQLQVVDLTSWPEAGRRAEAARLAQAEAVRPFDLSCELFRVWLFRVSAEEHILLMMLHHIMSDGWSESVLVRELGILYTAYQEGRPSPLPELEAQYADYALWQREWLQGEILERQIAYWREQLRGMPAALELPTDRPRPATFSYKGARHPLALSRELTARLEALGRREGATLYMTLLAALQVVLSRWSGQDDIAVGSPIAGRTHRKTEGLIGFFLNTLVMRTDLSGDPTFVELLRRVKSVTLGAYAHQDLPFEKLVAELQPERDLSRQALVQVMFTLQNMPLASSGLPGLTGRRAPLARTTSKFDLTIEFFEMESGLEGAVEYATDLFDRETIERFAGNFKTLLEAVVEGADRPISELPLLGEAERRLLLEEWNETARDYPNEKLIHELFEEQVERLPDATAVVYEDARLSYGELNRRANQLAHYLRELGVGPEARVGICLNRSIAMVEASLGALKAGAAYVPLDPADPPDRLMYMLEDARLIALISEQEVIEKMSGYSGRIISIDTDREIISWNRVENPASGATAENLAYVIYTSGSTGHPKGVGIEHRGLVNLVTWHQSEFRVSSQDRATQLAAVGFDASVWEVWPYLTAGASVYLGPEDTRRNHSELLTWLERNEVTIAFLPTPLAEAVLAEGWPATVRMRELLTGGDRLRRAAVAGKRISVINNYGPTESTVVATSGRVEEGAGEPSIGRPIQNAQIYILDEKMRPTPVGVPGELYISGAGLARGYLDRPDLTGERFIANDFVAEGKRMYRTGDLGRWRADGTIEFLGRNDFQVKIRGYRIELGEIEARLAEHAGVGQAVVIVRDDNETGKRLVAYYTGEEVGAESLRAHLSSSLPEYMAPAAFVFLSELPLNPNGKLDRKALPAPEAGAYGVRGYEAPVGEIEIRLARIWAEILKLERVGRHDNFFELGGHSLLAVTLIERMRREGAPTNGRTIFTSPTLKALAEAVAGGAEKEIEAPPNLIPAGCQVITPEMLPLIALTQAEIDGIVAGAPGGAANIKDIYPLAPLQEGILFHHLMSAQGDAYLASCLLAFDTRQQLDNFVGALSAVIARHDILRTAVVWEGLPEPAQVVWREAPLAIEEVAMDSSVDVASRLRASFDPRIIRLDVRRAPLMRCVIAHDAANERWLMLWLCHHLAGDHTTQKIMTLEAQAFLQGESERLPVPLPFRNFVAQARLGVSWSEHEAFFREMLGGVEEPTAPFGLLDAQGDGSGIQDARLELGAALASRLREQARRLRVSAASLCHLAWAQALARVSGREDVVFGTVLFGRMRGGEGADRALGLFINTLPVRIQVGAESVERSARRTHELLAGLMRHEHASLALAQRCSAVAAPTPLFSSVFNYRHSPRPAEAAQVWVGIEMLESEQRTNYPVTFSVDDLGDDFLLTAQTVTSINPIRICDLMKAALERLVKALETAPRTAAAAIDVLPEAERHRLLVEWNATETDYPKEKLVHRLFEEQAERTPRAVAVVHGGRRLTYAELNARANRLAYHLLGIGVEPGARVALLLERSIELVAAQLAVLKCGAVYVPIDPTFPGERQVFMVDDCAAPVVITAKNTVLPEGLLTPRIDIDEVSLTKGRKENPNIDADSRVAAYVMYTSGSTGRPKGVVVTHRAIVSLVINCGYADFNESDRVAFAANPAFDAATMEIWAPLLNGGRIVVVDREAFLEPRLFAQLLERQGVTALFLTTAIFNQYALAIPEALARLRYLFCGGEKNDPSSFARVLEHSGPRHLVHCYGPTETTTFAITHEVTEVLEGTRSIPLGRPISNTQIYILDANLQPTPIGVTGEIYIGGAGVARGYLNRPELTEERFLADSFSDEPGARMYKTGDLGRWLADGTIEFVGRNDFQVKIRGFRVELGEIEARLAEHAGVGQAVVVMQEGAAGDKRLVAYYTCVEETGGGVGAEELRRHLSASLPEYMAPASFALLEELPLNPNGKVDRKALPAPDLSEQLERQYVAPRTPTEEALAQIWAEALGLERVGMRDNFFELGGHSLFALAVISRANQAGLRVTLREIFEHQTIDRLAARVESRSPVQAEQGIIIGETAFTPMLRRCLESWSEHLADNITLYSLECRDRISSDLLREAIQHLIIHHDALRLTLSQEGSDWRQWIAGIDQIDSEALLLDLDLSGCSPSERERDVKQTEKLLVSMVNVSNSSMIRAALCDYGQGQPQALLIAIHHWINDTLSSKILLDDLQTAYQQLARGQEVRLPAKTTSFKRWAEEVENYGKSDLLESEAAFWREQLSRKAGRIPTKSPVVGGSRDVCYLINSLTRKETQTLLQATLPELRARLDEALLAALAGGLVNQLGIDSFQVELMHHGREHSFRDVDVSRTVGWFSNEIPLLLDVGSARNPRQMIETVKEQVRGIPSHGIGYGVLRYLNRDSTLCALPRPKLRLNNQGDFGMGDRSKLFQVLQATFMADLTGDVHEQLINITVFLREGCLTLQWMYDRRVYEEEVVLNLMENVITQIRSLIDLTPALRKLTLKAVQ